MLSSPLFSSYRRLKSSYLTVPVRSMSNKRKAISYSASGFISRFSKTLQSVRVMRPVLRRSATWKSIEYCSLLILCCRERVSLTGASDCATLGTQGQTYVVLILGRNGVDELVNAHICLVGFGIGFGIVQEASLALRRQLH